MSWIQYILESTVSFVTSVGIAVTTIINPFPVQPALIIEPTPTTPIKEIVEVKEVAPQTTKSIPRKSTKPVSKAPVKAISPVVIKTVAQPIITPKTFTLQSGAVLDEQGNVLNQDEMDALERERNQKSKTEQKIRNAEQAELDAINKQIKQLEASNKRKGN